MGISYRKSARMGKSRVNVSKSGASVSRRVGPVSVSSRGRGSVSLGHGLRWTFRLFK
jgi:hypothetical protein